MKVTDKEILNSLEKLGLTLYEARAYLCLLRHGESYGSEISKKSGVPGPKIYETLARLVEKGLAYLIEGNPVRYQALPLEEFLKGKEKEVNRIADFLRDHQGLIEAEDAPELLWHISGRRRLLDKAKELISRASQEILISLWPEESAELEDCLKKAEEGGVRVISIQFGEKCLEVGRVYRHIMVPTVYERHGSEMFLLVDKSEGMFMYFEKLKGWKGYYTSAKGVARVIENYIRHDIYINRLIAENYDFIMERYGENVDRLLEI